MPAKLALSPRMALSLFPRKESNVNRGAPGVPGHAWVARAHMVGCWATCGDERPRLCRGWLLVAGAGAEAGVGLGGSADPARSPSSLAALTPPGSLRAAAARFLQQVLPQPGSALCCPLLRYNPTSLAAVRRRADPLLRSQCSRGRGSRSPLEMWCEKVRGCFLSSPGSTIATAV